MKQCLYCSKETENPKFCSRSCAASFTNKASPKRKAIPRFCKHCNVPITKRTTTCLSCNQSYVDWTQVTKGSVTDKRKYQVHSRIRELARRSCKNRIQECLICGYNKYVEVAHKKAVYSFADDVPIATINSPDNLILLCPNCHKEFDRGLISLP